MPKEIQELMFTTNDTFFYNPKTLVDEKKAIVFTGDLIDRGEYTIRNLVNMLALKKNNLQNVILICGNRDINKIRMHHECFINDIKLNILDKDININITDILNELKKIPNKNSKDKFLFLHSNEIIAKKINIKGLTNPLNKDGNSLELDIERKTLDCNFKASYRNDIYRIEDIYSNTLGSPNQISFFKEEFKILFNLNDELDNRETLLKFIAMMNMVMGKIWDNLPSILERYNGLYIKYLQKCHIMAMFKIGQKLCFASHSGIPTYNIDKYNIPSKIGIHENVGNNINIESLVQLNNEFNNFINNPIDFNSYDYEKYVAMAAGCEEEGLTGLSSYASPIVSYPSLEDIRIKNNKDIILDEKYSTYKKRYNIFGHQPSGLLPYMNKVTKEDIFSYHIDLDISKAENIGGISNKISYVYLEITENEDLLKGKTESGLPYKIVTKNDNNLIDSGQSEEGTNITIEYAIPLDNYYDNRIEANYNKKPGLIFSIDNSINHYGMFGYQLVKYTKQEGGSGKNKKKIYIKSDKRFMNGKRKMIIYLVYGLQ
jgi:hypothetical protein